MGELLFIGSWTKPGTHTYIKLVSESGKVGILDGGTVDPHRIQRHAGERRQENNRLQWLQPFVAACLMVMSLLIPGISLGETFWEDNFENGLMPNWDTGACGDPAPQDGCNPSISTEQAHSGTRSLKADYLTSCNEDGCGAFYDRQHPPTDEIWTRFYYRTTNFTYNSVSTKWFYNADMWSQPGYPNGWWGTQWGGRQVHFEMQNPAEACPDGSGDGYSTCGYFANMASIDLIDNAWYCIETHAKLNTRGIADGAVEAFVNGTQVMGYYNRLFRGEASDGPNGNSSNTTFNYVRIYTQFGSGLLYYDDFAVGNSRIGCQDGSNPSSTPTPLDAPALTPQVDPPPVDPALTPAQDDSAITPSDPADSAIAPAPQDNSDTTPTSSRPQRGRRARGPA